MGCEPAPPGSPLAVALDLGAPDATLGAVLRLARESLAAAGVPEAAVDARRLLAHALACDPARLIVETDRVPSASERTAFATLLARRHAREPVSRIIGTRDFYGRRFTVTPDVLDPRADTEVVVETALALLAADAGRQPTSRVLDIGTGSGVILATVLAECPAATGLGIDISAAALAVARSNAEVLGLGARATFAPADLYSGLPAGFDLWIANPPYVTSAEIATLETDVRRYDPHLALDGGADGLAAYRAILAAAFAPTDAAGTPGWLVLEIGATQAADVIAIACRSAPPEARDRVRDGIRLVRDLGSRPRCVVVPIAAARCIGPVVSPPSSRAAGS